MFFLRRPAVLLGVLTSVIGLLAAVSFSSPQTETADRPHAAATAKPVTTTTEALTPTTLDVPPSTSSTVTTINPATTTTAPSAVRAAGVPVARAKQLASAPAAGPRPASATFVPAPERAIEPISPPGPGLRSAPAGGKLGVSFGGYRPVSRTQAFERYLGRPVGTVMVFTEENEMPSARHEGRTMIWSPKWRMRPTPTPDSTMLAYFRKLVELGQADAIVRPMWEANGPWMTGWFGPQDPDAWIARYRHIVALGRSVPGQSFRFEWNVSISEKDPGEVERFYPGDAFVDVIGMDVYGHYPIGKWTSAASGLEWVDRFAAAHGKTYGFSEWGVTDRDDPAYMDAMVSAISRPGCAYAVWNEYTASDGDHYVEDGKFPDASAKLRTAPL